MLEATYIDMFCVVAKGYNEPHLFVKELGFSSFYDMFNFNLGHKNSLAAALRRQLGLTPRSGTWSLESTQGHYNMLLAAACWQIESVPMAKQELLARQHVGFMRDDPDRTVALFAVRTAGGHEREDGSVAWRCTLAGVVVLQHVQMAPGTEVSLVRALEVPTDEALGVARVRDECTQWWGNLVGQASPAFGQVGRVATVSNHIPDGMYKACITIPSGVFALMTATHASVLTCKCSLSQVRTFLPTWQRLCASMSSA